MAIHNKSHSNSGLMQLNKMNKENIKHKTSVDFVVPEETNYILVNKDCLELLRTLPDESVQLILIDPSYNLDLAHWDTYDNYIAISRGLRSGLMNRTGFFQRTEAW